MIRTWFRLDRHDETDPPEDYRTATREAYDDALRKIGAIPGRGRDHRNAHRKVVEAVDPTTHRARSLDTDSR
jgi:hypothetical protein